ncbi:MAG: penicillin-binding protein activator, partial [Bdellovibrio sp.]|nr:penicillin-binding protein activator [Bdellovibrio sp.]
ATDSRAIGVLLPVTGKYSKFGNKAIQGLELAFDIFGPKGGDSFTLVIEDSGDEPAQAVKALERLVFQHHVVAVIGPMLSKGIEPIAQKARDLGVPLLSLARRETPPMDFVFQAGLTQQIQAFEIARFAIEKMNLKKFAILTPNDKMGQEIAQFFWDAVETLGGKVVGSESYNVGETDFRQPVDKLSGLFYTNARQRELDQKAKDRDELKIKKRTRRTEQYFALHPIVDYDAVFIPDEAKVAGQIIPTFAYRDVEKVRFLGTAAWNSPEFINRTQSQAEDAAFVEAFYPDNMSPTAKKFIDGYRKTFDQEPGSIEALSFDAGSLLKQILTESPIMGRAELRNRLRETKGFSGVTGKLTFRDGQFFRNLRLITVKNGRFIATD